MNDGVILDIDSFADYDFVIVTTDDDAGPQIGTFFYSHFCQQLLHYLPDRRRDHIWPLVAERINDRPYEFLQYYFIMLHIHIYHSTGRHKTDTSLLFQIVPEKITVFRQNAPCLGIVLRNRSDGLAGNTESQVIIGNILRHN